MTLPAQRDGGNLLLHSVMLAEYVKVDPAGLLTVLSGGITRFSTDSLPTQLSIGIAIQVSNVAQRHITTPLLVQVNRPNGTGATRIVGEMRLEAGSEFSNMGFNMPVNVEVEGRWTIEVSFGEREPRADLWFNVALLTR